MEAIPAINCSTKECVQEKFTEIRGLGAVWAHVDITDGNFSSTVTCNDVNEYKYSRLFLEIHLMVKNPELIIDEWLSIGAKRIIVHVESFIGRDDEVIREISTKCKKNGAELMLSENPDTAVEELFAHAGAVDSFQLLAVNPGPSGQGFDEGTIGKIKKLREKMPNSLIEVDGGITPDIAMRAMHAGADVVVSASYIFGSKDPQAAFNALKIL
ncbi:MAG: hypothetical protein WCO21_03120 [bacterium]|nr:hypothetical protein [Candidatus Jorgensenbacteria bacterium]